MLKIWINAYGATLNIFMEDINMRLRHFFSSISKDLDNKQSLSSVLTNLATYTSFTTANRPTLTVNDIGFMGFDTTLGKPIWWNGTGWVDSTGTTI